MDWKYTCFFLFINVALLQAKKRDETLENIVRILKRRHSGHTNILGSPRDPEELPEAEPILPGHTLIRPALGMLKSALKFPMQDKGNLVYGNLDNLGITYGKTSERVLHTGFRRANDKLLESAIIQAIRKIQAANGNKKDVYFLEIEPKSNVGSPHSETVNEEKNDASEILDMSAEVLNDFRRKSRKRSKEDFTSDDNDSWDESTSISSSSSSKEKDYQKNPGNPFTVHKEKYLQNYLWNHVMDGDHMNVNPLAPEFKMAGPSGPDLFFVRKWWYFNQDDYRPLR